MKKILTILFSILYLAVGFVSVYHSINFFAISNEGWLALILAIAFEIGQAAVLFSLLVNKTQKVMPWILTTYVQRIALTNPQYFIGSIKKSPRFIKFCDTLNKPI